MNADIKKYMIGEDGAPRLFKVDTTSVGRNISTKAVGSSRREDLTDQVSSPLACLLNHIPSVIVTILLLSPPSPLSLYQYKYPEGDSRERRALYHGHEELLKETHDMTFEIPQATYSFGQDVTFVVSV